MRRWTYTIIGLFCAGLLGVLAFRKVDWGEALGAVRRADWPLLALVPLVCAASPLLRAMRWRVILSGVPGAGTVNLIRAAGISVAAGYALPGKLGEAVGAHVLGRLIDRNRLEALGVVFVTRVADLFVLFTLVAVATVVFPSMIPSTIRVAGWSLAITCAALLAGTMLARGALPAAVAGRLTRLLGARLSERGLALVQHFVRGLLVFRSPGQLAAFVFHTLLLWLTIAGSMWLAAIAFGLKVPWYMAPLVTAVAAVGAMLPSAPGNVGTFHFFGVMALSLVSLDRDSSAACIITYHALDLAAALIFGGLCLIGTQSPLWSPWSGAVRSGAGGAPSARWAAHEAVALAGGGDRLTLAAVSAEEGREGPR